MDIDDLMIKGFLEELYRQTGGDAEKQVSMYDVGTAIGLDKSEAGSLAEQLIVQGQVELKTLSGGISITSEGLAVLGISAPLTQSAENNLHLGNGPVADDTDRDTIQQIIGKIKKELSDQSLEYDLLEEIIIDLKTIEVYMLSPRPKVAVILEIFRSLKNAFETTQSSKIATLLTTIIG
jgi:hypothetical protein